MIIIIDYRFKALCTHFAEPAFLLRMPLEKERLPQQKPSLAAFPCSGVQNP
jgi:hypothetical protein